MIVLDKVAKETKDLTVRFCALAHDFGKGVTPLEELPKHYGHDVHGAQVVHDLPSVFYSKWKKAAMFVCRYHMQAITIRKAGKIVDLLGSLKRSGLSVKDFATIVYADSSIEPWFLCDFVFDVVMGKIVVDKEIMIPQYMKQYVHKVRVQRLKEME